MEKITTALYDEKKLTGEYFFEALKYNGQCDVRFRATDEGSLFEHLKSDVPNVLILHLRPDRKGHRDLIGKLKNRFPIISPLVVLINYEPTPNEVFNLLAAGAKGIIPDTYTHQDLMQAMEEVLTNGAHFNHICPDKIFEISNRKKSARSSFSTEVFFSEKESRIVYLKKEGRTSAEVGELLFLSNRTVDNILNKLYERFNCHNIIELIMTFDKYKLNPRDIS